MCLSYEGHVQIFMKSCFMSGTFLTFSVNPYRTHDMLHTFCINQSGNEKKSLYIC